MHRNGFAHRNISASSILLTKNLTVKLTNFGLSKYLSNRQKAHSIVGKPEIMAPEMSTGSYDWQKSDLFSAGILLLKMVAGEALDERPIYDMLGSLNIKSLWAKLRASSLAFGTSGGQLQMSKSFQSLIESMLCFDPYQRQSLDQILSHDWLQISDLDLNLTKESIIFKTIEIQLNRSK